MNESVVRIAIAVFYFLCASADQPKVVLITGASRGLGFETAELLAERGFTVYGTVRNSPPNSQNGVHFVWIDLLDEQSVQNTVQAILEREGRIDVLINNAGYAVVGPVESMTENEMHDQMEVNFFAPIRFIQAVLPWMREQQSGRIINISSVNAFQTPPFGSLYAASKAALESLSESLCIEVKPHRISVSIIEPGFIQTRFALPMGTREIRNNPYRVITDAIQADIEERIAHPERLDPSQTAREVAEFLFGIIQEPHPKLRYQTSEHAKELVSKKLVDLTGDIFLEEVEKNSKNMKD